MIPKSLDRHVEIIFTTRVNEALRDKLVRLIITMGTAGERDPGQAPWRCHHVPAAWRRIGVIGNDLCGVIYPDPLRSSWVNWLNRYA